MICCYFARLLGERKLKISDVALETGINRGTLTRLYYETAERVDLDVLDKLCAYFKIDLVELIDRIPVNEVGAPALGSVDVSA